MILEKPRYTFHIKTEYKTFKCLKCQELHHIFKKMYILITLKQMLAYI